MPNFCSSKPLKKLYENEMLLVELHVTVGAEASDPVLDPNTFLPKQILRNSLSKNQISCYLY